MVALTHILALLAVLALANGGALRHAPTSGPVAYDVFMPSGG